MKPASPFQMMLATVIVDMGMYHPLFLDKDTCSALGLQWDSRVTLSFPGVGKLENLTYQSPDLSHLKTFTKQYATELNEIPVLGIVGLPAFDNQPVMMDLGQGVLEYGEVVRTGDDWRSLVWTQAESGGYRIAIRPAADYTLQAAFSTGSYETWIDAVCASIAGFPGGDFDYCDIAGLNLNAYTAVRPVASVSAGYPDAVIGNSFWQNFQVIIEPLSQTVWFRDKKAGLSDLKEQVFFKALIDEDIDAVEAYVDAYPASRLAGEATETLLEWRFNEPVLDRESIERAVLRMAGTGAAKEVAEKLIGYADSLFEKEQYDGDVIPLLLEQAKACTLKTTDALLLGYEAEGRMGRYAIFKKDWSNARLHLLAALFGQPNNPQFNYWMGQYYEANGQLTRAWSRYLKASLAEQAVSEAMRSEERRVG